MTSYKPLKLPVTEPHLSVEQLYLYLEGRLPAGTSLEVQQHLKECNLCADALDGLKLVPQSEAEHALFEINRHLKKRTSRQSKNNILKDIKNWGMLAAIIFLLLFSAIVVWYQVNQSSTVVPHLPVPTPKVTPIPQLLQQ